MGRSCRGPRQPGSYTASSNKRAWWISFVQPRPVWLSG
uniref:Glycerol-3-phosphate dehydrogenase 1 like n=1 Tax=Molossus molossus TaxID=27622 RepID=A0A7J8FXQ0_MOLMO|nr:glycerol-3-phosphate dehydrogenase 1 like [Molossus molossus]